ncbi:MULTISPECIES: SDR family oxidoreductase [Providencia]|uniref:SDR family oxidoreductase n=1 Tax=Providencia TaxID=586 RepID=UPI0008384B1B|nr:MULTISPECIES: SDR family oxidoreductase [Providencia]MBP6120954.1 SDR family oxidoreductase [Providencia sp.]NIH23496.1 SDR family oxidoreductase [Providencia heimbachae]
MKKVTIIGLGWLGLPLASSLLADGVNVVGTKTTPDGVDAARAIGIDCYALKFTPELECEQDDLEQLMSKTDVIVILLPPSKVDTEHYIRAIEQLVDSAMAFNVPRVIFTSSTSVYGEQDGVIDENASLQAETASASALIKVEQWLHKLPNISVDILRLAGLVGDKRHAGRFLAGKTGVKGANQRVNIVHQDDVIAAITLLIQQPQGGHIYNLCAPIHPTRTEFYHQASLALGLVPPEFVEDENRLEGKIINGDRICLELGFEYEYPDPRTMNMSL